MPTVRKLAPEEAQQIENKGKGQRKLTEEQYDRFLSEYEVGDYAEAALEESENRLTVRNRFKAAAERRGVSLRFLRTTGDIMRFQVVAANGSSDGQVVVEVPEPEPEPVLVASDTPPAPKRRGGRPKKANT
jgi:hypothetical protein